MNPNWLEWAQKLQAIAQTGLTYCENVFDIQRFEQIKAISADIIANYTQTDQKYILDLFNQESGYATPKVDVRGAVFRDNRILLVKERSDGCWSLPGGWADVGETASESVVKEIFEESGFRTRAVKLLAAYDRNKQGHPPYIFSVYRLFFACEIIGGSATPSIETEAVDFFPEDGIPPDLSLRRISPAQITRAFQHHHHPDLPTDFD
jgi:ADP-ribose pyrophosphatase YjhB (NUDIX family)